MFCLTNPQQFLPESSEEQAALNVVSLYKSNFVLTDPGAQWGHVPRSVKISHKRWPCFFHVSCTPPRTVDPLLL